MLFQRLKLSLIALDIIITQFFIQKEKIWKKKKENVGKDKTKCLFNIILHIITGILFADQEATVRTGHGTTDWFKLEKEYVNIVYCHPIYLTSMQSTLCEIPSSMKHKLE